MLNFVYVNDMSVCEWKFPALSKSDNDAVEQMNKRNQGPPLEGIQRLKDYGCHGDDFTNLQNCPTTSVPTRRKYGERSASGGGLQTLKISGTRLGIILKVLDIGSCPYPFMGWASIRNK